MTLDPKRKLALAACLASMLTFFGCATTSMLSTWREPTFQPDAPKKAVVIAVLKSDAIRHKLEDSLVLHLQEKGIAGVAGYSFMQDQKMNQEQILQEVNRHGADLILVSAVVDKKTTETYVPGTISTMRPVDPGFYGYYSSRWETSFSPDYMTTTEEAISEIKAFNAKDQKLVWTGTAATMIDTGVSDGAIDEFAKKVTESLLKGRGDQPR